MSNKYTKSDPASYNSFLFGERNNLRNETVMSYVSDLLKFYKINNYEFKSLFDKDHYIYDYIVLFIYEKEDIYMLWFDENENYIDQAINKLRISNNKEYHKKYKGKLDRNWKIAINEVSDEIRGKYNES